MDVIALYALSSSVAFLITLSSLPLLRKFLSPYLLDAPGGLKTHSKSTPTLGGCGILLGTVISLILIRLISDFPTGTLHSLRGVLLGGILIFTMGIIDDYKKPVGLSVSIKLIIQALATACLVYYGIVIELFGVGWLAYTCTFLWVVGLTNAFNLLDIQDGLCISQVIICTLGLFFITFHSQSIYINMAILALLGACLAFWPYNHAKKHKIFLGDSGSNFLGFIIASLSIGTQYSIHSDWAILAPLFLLAVPLFDTAFVSLARVLKRKNPLKGSNDHIALRLKKLGWKPTRILLAFSVVGIFCNTIAFSVMTVSKPVVLCLLGIVTLLAIFSTILLLQINMDTK